MGAAAGQVAEGASGPCCSGRPSPCPPYCCEVGSGGLRLAQHPTSGPQQPLFLFLCPPTPGHVHGAYVRYKQKNQWHRAPHWVRVGTQNALRLGSEGPGAALFPRVNMTTVS